MAIDMSISLQLVRVAAAQNILFPFFPVHEWSPGARCGCHWKYIQSYLSSRTYPFEPDGIVTSKAEIGSSDNPVTYFFPCTSEKRVKTSPSFLLSDKSFVSGICVDHLRLDPRICEIVSLALSQSSLCLRYIAIVALASSTYLDL